MTRWMVIGTAVAACGPVAESADTDAGAGAQAVPPGPPRTLYGRVHDANDYATGLVGVEVRAGGEVAVTDLTGQYRVTAPTPLPTLSVDARDQGFTPAVFHLPDWGEALELSPPLMPLDLTEQALALMSASAPISPVFREDRAYLVAVVQYVGQRESEPGGAEVRVTADGEPFLDLYAMRFNEVLGTCLPMRAEGGVASSDARCDGVVLAPEVPVGAEVTVDMFHPIRDCAPSKEQRLAGEVSSTVTTVFTVEAGALNLTQMDCKWPSDG